MEEKHNQATPQRPKGARALDAPIIPIDIPKYIDQLKQEDAYHKNGKNAITVFKSDKITITLIVLKKDQSFYSGAYKNEVIMSLNLIAGHLSFESLGSVMHLKDGELLTLHQQLLFDAKAISDSICLLTLFNG